MQLRQDDREGKLIQSHGVRATVYSSALWEDDAALLAIMRKYCMDSLHEERGEHRAMSHKGPRLNFVNATLMKPAIPATPRKSKPRPLQAHEVPCLVECIFRRGSLEQYAMLREDSREMVSWWYDKNLWQRVKENVARQNRNEFLDELANKIRKAEAERQRKWM